MGSYLFFFFGNFRGKESVTLSRCAPFIYEYSALNLAKLRFPREF